jgi:hypothetical protein
MAKRNNVKKEVKVIDKNAAQFMRTAQNLFKKGKTNKKLHGRNANPRAMKYNIA